MKRKSPCGLCRNCATNQYIDIYDFEVKKKYDLENYNLFKEIVVTKCTMCNFASENIFDFPAEKVRHIINSPKYQDVISYGYLSESKIQASYIFEQYNPNEYEAYSILCLETGDYEGFARSLNMAIVLKEKLMQKMRDFQNEVYGEMASEQNFEKFYDLMNISIKNNKANLCKVLKENKVSVFAKALLVETLIGLGFNEIAKNELEKIEDKLLQDLKEKLSENLD